MNDYDRGWISAEAYHRQRADAYKHSIMGDAILSLGVLWLLLPVAAVLGASMRHEQTRVSLWDGLTHPTVLLWMFWGLAAIGVGVIFRKHKARQRRLRIAAFEERWRGRVPKFLSICKD